MLDKACVKAGTITFKATNNTFGFAQVFVYDTGGNSVAHHDKDIPQRGGGVIEFTGELSAGNYTVHCDGPGGDDEPTPLVAEQPSPRLPRTPHRSSLDRRGALVGLQGSGAAVRAWRDVHEVRRLDHSDLVPDTARDDERIALA